MNRHPQNERLDAEERTLAALLPRPHGRAEPGPELDARILAAARAATQPAKPRPTPQRRRSWSGPTAVAASLMLAVGLAWQLRPPAALPAPAAEAASAAAGAESDALMVRAIEPAPDAAAAPTAEPHPRATLPAPSEPRPPARIANAAAAADKPEFVAAPPPPPAPPAPVIVEESPAVAAAMPAPQMAPPPAPASARMAAPAMAKSQQADAFARERTSAAGNAASQEDAARAADAGTLDTVTIQHPREADAEEPEEDVPPATADSPQVRDAWLRRIGELLKQGKSEDAKASLGEFRRRYPDAAIPPELRKLEQ